MSTHTESSRLLLEWLADRIHDLDHEEAHTADRGRLDAFLQVRHELRSRLSSIEADAVCTVLKGVTFPEAERLLEAHDVAA